MNANEKTFLPTPRTTMVKVLWLPGFITLPLMIAIPNLRIGPRFLALPTLLIRPFPATMPEPVKR